MPQVFDYVEAADFGVDDTGAAEGAPIIARGGWHTPQRDLTAEWRAQHGRAASSTERSQLARLAKRSNDVFLQFEGHRSPSRNDERDFNTAQNLISFYVRNGRGPDGGDPLTGKLGQPETTALINAATSAVPGPSSFFSDIVHTAGNVVHTVEHAASSAAHTVTHPGDALKAAAYAATHPAATIRSLEHAAAQVGKVVGKVTNNPLWKIAQTGAAFIPGVGQAVSAGMASAAAVGRGESLKDIGLAATRGALPGPAQIAFDIAMGAVKGHSLDAIALKELRDQLPAELGEVGKGAFDAAVMLATKADPGIAAKVGGDLSAAARSAFTAALNAHAAGPPAVHKLTAPAPGRSKVVRVSVRDVPHGARPFPQLNRGANKAAAALMATPALRSLTTAKVGQALRVDNRDVRSAVAAFLERFGATRELDYRDVGEFETFDQAARKHQVYLPPDIGAWPAETGELHVVQIPAVPVARKMLHAVYQRGDSNIRRALLAHELLAHVARNTGELEGTSWVVQGNGDWPSKVAKTVVGDESRWKEILPLNPFLKLQSNGNIPQWTKGTRIQLPPSWFPSAVPVAAAPATPAPSGGPPFNSEYPLGYPSATYTIRAGDTGEKVAERITGNKARWKELLTANPTLAGPHGIELYEGKSLRLPPSWVKAQPTPVTSVIANPPPPLPEPTTQVTAPPASSPPIAKPPVSDGGIGSPPAQPPFTPAPVGLGNPAAPSGPVVTGTTEQIALVQIMLASFYRDHPDATYTVSGAPYGADPADFAGEWTDRTTAAFLGFERWWNGKGKTPTLVADGLPDGDAVQALINQIFEDGGSVAPGATPLPISLSVQGVQQKVATAPTKKKSSSSGIGPLLLLAALGS